MICISPGKGGRYGPHKVRVILEKDGSTQSWESEYPLYSQDELRRRIARYRGTPSSNGIPKKPSTVLAILDITYLANIDRCNKNFWDFMKNKHTFGEKVSRRLSRAVYLCDSGRVRKFQWKLYAIYDKPWKPAVKEMRVNVNFLSGVTIVKPVPEAKFETMPTFAELFGRRNK